MNYFRELRVWQKSMDLVKEIYRTTEKFSQRERYGLPSQIRRAAVSIPSNIAEGCGRSTNKDFNNFLGIAFGSSFELETQLMLSKNMQYLKIKDYEAAENEIHHIQNMIIKLQKSLE